MGFAARLRLPRGPFTIALMGEEPEPDAEQGQRAERSRGGYDDTAQAKLLHHLE
jgi:hypothetical protein